MKAGDAGEQAAARARVLSFLASPCTAEREVGPKCVATVALSVQQSDERESDPGSTLSGCHLSSYMRL
eukprot:NODE_25694_length_578_cov_2.700665.p4 GENE.NODE_25694_length_578_cov_2.700665~~NODE_25694_length_578_cov_2.700665.p4  ORF type:complete len:68 (-),score=1.87 NODE_25694_length_578_cov_2.700665:118-321(-)